MRAESKLRIEEIRSRRVHPQPGPVTQEAMDLIRQHELLVLDPVLAECFCETDRFGERNVVIVVTVHEEDGRAPARHRADRRCYERTHERRGWRIEYVQWLVVTNRRERPVVPVVHAVQVDAC